jgi:hypothetical protein
MSVVILAQIGTADSLCSAAPLRIGRGRTARAARGRAGGWRPGQAQGQAGQLEVTVAPPHEINGHVPCAVSVQEHEPGNAVDVSVLWQPHFPTAELVHAAADLLPSIREPSRRATELAEGPRWEIVVSPGVVRVRTRDYARAGRAHERAVRRHQADVDMAVTYLRDGDEVPEPLSTRGTIYAWSPRSRARMIARLSDLDYTAL